MTSLPDLIRQLRELLNECQCGTRTLPEQKRDGDDIIIGYELDDAYGWSFATFNGGDDAITKDEADLYIAMRNSLPALLDAAECTLSDDHRMLRMQCMMNLLNASEEELKTVKAKLAKSQEECAAIVNSTLKELDEVRARAGRMEKELLAILKPDQRTYHWLYADKAHPISYPQLSDEELAGQVRMLCGRELSHESLVTAARDRIMHLSEIIQTQFICQANESGVQP